MHHKTLYCQNRQTSSTKIQKPSVTARQTAEPRGAPSECCLDNTGSHTSVIESGPSFSVILQAHAKPRDCFLSRPRALLIDPHNNQAISRSKSRANQCLLTIEVSPLSALHSRLKTLNRVRAIEIPGPGRKKSINNKCCALRGCVTQPPFAQLLLSETSLA
jgi:hypothetical protein